MERAVRSEIRSCESAKAPGQRSSTWSTTAASRSCAAGSACGFPTSPRRRETRSSSRRPQPGASASPSDQRLADDTRVFYLAHHGDTWVQDPFVATYHLSPAEARWPSRSARSPRFRRCRTRDSPGRRGTSTWPRTPPACASTPRTRSVYQSFVGSVGGFVNAWKVAVDGERAYVADAEGWSQGPLARESGSAGRRSNRSSHRGAGPRRRCEPAGRVFVAMGGAGRRRVRYRSRAAALSHAKTLSTRGSAQAVSASAELLSVAAWNHVAALRRPAPFALGNRAHARALRARPGGRGSRRSAPGRGVGRASTCSAIGPDSSRRT
jgi:hypothetical protein